MGQFASALSNGMKKTMDENFKRTIDFQQENFQIQLERQLVLQNEMRERQMSMQIARSREILTKYYGPFYAFVLGGGVVALVVALAIISCVSITMRNRFAAVHRSVSENSESHVFRALRGKPALLIPSIPLGFVTAFQYDMAFGTLMQKARAKAENILLYERERIALPNGLPTFDGIESKRLEAKK